MNDDRRIRRIAIVGGGTAGWMAASALARVLRASGTTIHLVESPDIPTVGVGEATIPPIMDFLRFLGIDGSDFIQHTQATFKLAIRFRDWLRLGHDYWHPFGSFGATIERRRFYHYFQKARALGLPVDVGQFSLEISLAQANKFVAPNPARGIAPDLRYALHFDAGLVARYLRSYA